jgi:hypothetical protein
MFLPIQEEALFFHAPGKLDDKICMRVDESCPDIHGQTSKTSNQLLKKLINNSGGKYKRNECLFNVCKSDKDLS